MNIIGIDPGVNGGICTYNAETKEYKAYAMPKTDKEVAKIFADFTRIVAIDNVIDGDIKCYIEKVHAMPGQGVVSMFTFGRGVGFLHGVLTSYRIPHEEIRPLEWQRGLGIPKRNTKAESKPDFKIRLRQFAEKLFPTVDLNLKTADAILIAEYGRRLTYGELR